MPQHFASAADAVRDLVFDGAVIAVGGFGLGGNPFDLIEAVRDSGAKNLTIISNNMGVDGQGLGILLENGQVSKVISSYVGENKHFAQLYLDGKLEVEFSPQGTLAERLRAGGAGIAAFYTKTGVGTLVAEGKEHKVFNGETYIEERGILADLALVHAYQGDRAGNLIYRHTARNFNPITATASKQTIAEVEHIVDGYLDPNQIITPGIFIQRMVQSVPREKPIEQRTMTPRSTATDKGGSTADPKAGA